jgi:hypothetical protein
MESQRTCGQGLAEHSPLPAKLAELTASVAENLELHMKALDPTDESSRKEYDAYLELANGHRKIAAQLQSIARQMAGYRDLPMGTHDQKAMSTPEVREPFQRFVALEEELRALLDTRLERDRRMLIDMHQAAGGAAR